MPSYFFNLETRSHEAAQAELELCKPSETSNLKFPCHGLLSSWDNKQVPPEPVGASFFSFLNLLKLASRMLTFFVSPFLTYVAETIKFLKAAFHRSGYVIVPTVTSFQSLACLLWSMVTYISLHRNTYVYMCVPVWVYTCHICEGTCRSQKEGTKITGTGVTGLR